MAEPIYNMNDLMKRVKSLQVFTVERELAEDFAFTGTVPYDMKISEGIAYIKVYAVDLTEANQKVDDFLANSH
jgi:hypothetical protein